MRKIAVSIPGENPYPILVGEGVLARMGEVIQFDRYSKVAVLTDSTLSQIWLPKVRAFLPSGILSVVVPPGEASKNVSVLSELWSKLSEAGLDRKSLLINLGGGAIGDLGGFVASTFMRGIDFAHIPTTLLAQVDSSIGGKTGIDHYGVKNLVGTFAQPVAVIADIGTLGTLPQRELLSGFAEVIKHALIKDAEYLSLLTSKQLEEFEDHELSEIIAHSIEIKRKIVESDVKESGERKLLNFGHTIGHAIEAVSLESEVALLHGEAISLGMIAEARLSVLCGLLPEAKIEGVLEVISHFQLPQKLPPMLNKEEIARRVAFDKKNESGVLNCTLLREIGVGAINQKVTVEQVRGVLDRL